MAIVGPRQLVSIVHHLSNFNLERRKFKYPEALSSSEAGIILTSPRKQPFEEGSRMAALSARYAQKLVTALIRRRFEVA
jgi:hypothetical protein